MFQSNVVSAFLLLTTFSVVVHAQDCVRTPLRCTKLGTDTDITLDADLSDWTNDNTVSTVIVHALSIAAYDDGAMNMRCRYDDEQIYLALEIPGLYGFNVTDNHHCAAIATMMKVGVDASFINMGGCPDVCADTGVPDTCDSYRVDIGGHWELKDTQQFQRYDAAVPAAGEQGSGNDLIANKDDEYAVSPYCRFDDDDASAANEWAGAWAHTNSVQGEPGTYVFELSRSLQTASELTDAQLSAGKTYGFGVAFWDPFQTPTGWTAIGHYVTGCGSDWIDLILADENTPADAGTVTDAECLGSETLRCEYTGTTPVLDANLTEWSDVEATTTGVYHAMKRELYQDGQVSYKCLYDDDNMYLTLEIPGLYRFNATDNHYCAAIGTMMKMGQDASFLNMGGCPDAASGCDGSVPDTCNSYRVDIGAHWELKDTTMNTLYGVNGQTGNDIVANKDDEYAVSSFCRFDDDDANAANEWSGAWAHTNPTDGEPGLYVFELSRSLQTASALTDAQLAAGESYSFGIAFWDPYETETGWTDSGHYVTGCGTDWFTLELAEKPGDTESAAFGSSVTMVWALLAVCAMVAGSL